MTPLQVSELPTPAADPSGTPFPAGPPYPELLESDEAIAWVRYKVWSADWYTARLGELGGVLGYDRHIGIEMALDGALGALSGAFDAAVAMLTEEIQDELAVESDDRVPVHLYGWARLRKLLVQVDNNELPMLADVVADIDDALEGANTIDPTGWLAVLRRLRNRATHQTTLSRTWTIDGRNESTVIGVTEIPALDPFEYLKRHCNLVSDLTGRMVNGLRLTSR